MKENFFSDKVNLKEYPKAHIGPRQGNNITLGDMHGNTLLMIYFLIREQVLEMEEKDYLEVVRLYEKSLKSPVAWRTQKPNLSKQDIAIFKDILARAKVNDPKVNDPKVSNEKFKIRFSGDMLGDRGSNDFLTLLVLQIISDLDIDILLSNHDAEFLRHYESGALFNKKENLLFNNDGIQYDQAPSMHFFYSLIASGILKDKDVDEIDHIIRWHYLPRLKFLTYSEDAKTGQVNVFSHAPICLETIIELARQLDVDISDSPNIYQDKNHLFAVIDKLNQKLADIIKQKALTPLLDMGIEWHKNSSDILNEVFKNDLGRCLHFPKDCILPQYPLQRLLWNRALEKDTPMPEYDIVFIHGHIGSSPLRHPLTDKHYQNLDSDLGKSDISSVNQYVRRKSINTSPECMIRYYKSFAELENYVKDKTDKKGGIFHKVDNFELRKAKLAELTIMLISENKAEPAKCALTAIFLNELLEKQKEVINKGHQKAKQKSSGMRLFTSASSDYHDSFSALQTGEEENQAILIKNKLSTLLRTDPSETEFEKQYQECFRLCMQTDGIIDEQQPIKTDLSSSKYCSSKLHKHLYALLTEVNEEKRQNEPVDYKAMLQ